MYCGPFNWSFALALFDQVTLTIQWILRLAYGNFGMGVHTNNLQMFDQRKIVILEVTRTVALSIQIAGFYTQHFYVNVFTGLMLLIAHYYCYYGRPYREH